MTNTITLHHVTLTNVETLPNGYTLALDNEGHLRIHDGTKFHGYAQPWGKRFMISWNDPSRIGWRDRKTYKSQRGANLGLRVKALKLPAR